MFHQHRIEAGCHFRTTIDAAVDTKIGPVREAYESQPPGCRREIVFRNLRANSTFDRVPACRYAALLDGKFATGRDLELLFDQISSEHQLRDRMFNLQPRIHFKKRKRTVRREQKFDRSRTLVPGGPCDSDSFAMQCRPRFRRERLRRTFLNQFQETPLDRTFPFKEMNAVSVPISEDLNFDMSRSFDVSLDIDALIPKIPPGLAAGYSQRRIELAPGGDDVHAFPATTLCGLDDNRQGEVLNPVDKRARGPFFRDSV